MALSILTAPFVSAAQPNDGFVGADKVDGRYFTILMEDGIDQSSLVRSLDIGPFHKILGGQSVTKPDDLSSITDAFFVWVCGVLDMRLYSYKGTIKIVADEQRLAAMHRALYGIEPHSNQAFYVQETNTIYIVKSAFTKEIFGHEMAHALISNFFVVQPPAKVAEVLAGYIEYQLRK